ncbi:hypothetical protein BU16DRAFT_180903 [Lophium mytilinum]|uniref:Uncharacterized protein n=1 Tax=Lophium mytilinum TaxID=390894 RepID=A0A6A6QAV2_9PEZI|nr:hypothetical protein BU16DRAFT_180903 [Lophium mytilinum]
MTAPCCTSHPVCVLDADSGRRLLGARSLGRCRCWSTRLSSECILASSLPSPPSVLTWALSQSCTHSLPTDPPNPTVAVAQLQTAALCSLPLLLLPPFAPLVCLQSLKGLVEKPPPPNLLALLPTTSTPPAAALRHASNDF